MSLITRCAHCHTVFRITLEQLQVHGGQVRCGRCMQVFNGLAALSPDAVVTAVPGMVAPDVDIPAPVTAAAPPAAQPAVPQPEPLSEPRPEPQPEPQPETTQGSVETLEPVAEAVTVEPDVTEAEQGPDVLTELSPEEIPGPPPIQTLAAEPLPAVTPIDNDNPFVQASAEDENDEEKSTRARHPLLTAAIILLVIALGAQATFFYRDEIAARHPLVRQWLSEACAHAGCVVSLPQRPKAILIEASDLQVVDPARPNRIQLTATLRNHAEHDVAYPALDLVLTNINDHTLVRRIFLPAEYLGATRDPRTGIAANAELTVRLAMETGNLGAAGFRLAVLSAPQY